MSKHSASIVTDFYNLVMAYAYWESKTHETEAVYHFSFRKNPFQNGYIIFTGLSDALELLCKNFNITDQEKLYLDSLTDNTGKKIFSIEFLDYLQNSPFSCSIDAAEEGEVVFANEPVLRVTGPIIQCQLIESILLNIIGFQSLIATKASRIILAAKGLPVIEFGMRHAHGVDGALSASKAAFIGGVSATSNVHAGFKWGIPVRGTQGHAWVMFFESELDAFLTFGQAVSDSHNIFLVDTYSTLEGVKNAIIAGKKLAKMGKKLAGIRIDSGDLAWLSIAARKLLDEADLKDVKIFASNELDEHIISSLIAEGACIDYFGVGTKLVTAKDDPASSCVYKLSAIKINKEWVSKIKISEQAVKTSVPGILGVRRYKDTKGNFVGDMVYDIRETKLTEVIVDPFDKMRKKTLNGSYVELLKPLLKNGKQIGEAKTLLQIKEHAKHRLSKVDVSSKRLINPHVYPVGLEEKLFYVREKMIEDALKNR